MKKFFTLIVSLIMMLTSIAPVAIAIASAKVNTTEATVSTNIPEVGIDVAMNTARVGIDKLEEAAGALRTGGRRQRFGARHHRRHHRRYRMATKHVAHIVKCGQRLGHIHGVTFRRKTKYWFSLTKTTVQVDGGRFHANASKSAKGTTKTELKVLCPNGCVSGAKMFWPKEAEQAQQKHSSFVLKLLKMALLLPLLPLIGVHSTKRTDWSAKLEEAKKSESEASAKVDTLQKELDETGASELNETSTALTQAAEEVKSLKGQQEAYKAEEAAAEKQYADAAKRLPAAERELATANIKLERAYVPDAPCTENKDFVEGLRKTLNKEREKERTLLTAAKRSGNKKIYAARAAAAKRRVADAQRAFDSAMKTRRERMEIIADHQADMALLYKEVHDLEEEVATLRKIMDDATRASAKARVAWERIAPKLNDAQISKAVAKSNAELCERSVTKRKDFVKSKLEAAKNELEAARGLRERLEKTVAYNKQQHDKAVENRKAFTVEDADYLNNQASDETMAEETYVRLYTDALDVRTVYGTTVDEVKAGIAKITPKLHFDHAKMVLVDHGVKTEHYVRRVNGKLINTPVIMTKDRFGNDVAISAQKQYQSSVAKNKLPGGLMEPHFAFGDDYHGHGAYPDHVVVVLDPKGEATWMSCYATHDAAFAEFTKRNAALCGTAWEVQLFEHGELVRHSGDRFDREEAESAVIEAGIITLLQLAKVPKNIAKAVVGHFNATNRRGEAELKKAVEAKNADGTPDPSLLMAVPGIGARRAGTIMATLDGLLRAYEEPEVEYARYECFEKLTIGVGGAISEASVNVKASRLFRALVAKAEEFGLGTDAPVMIYVKHEISESKKYGPDTGAVKKLDELVKNGIIRHGVRYVPTLHGTNAARTCTTIWVREDLKAFARVFATADGSRKAKLTEAKFNAYMGLMAVGTDNMPFEFDANWLGVVPECEYKVLDFVRKVIGDKVTDVEWAKISQKPFDGAILCHFSEKVKQQLIDSCKTIEEKARMYRFIRDMESGSVRLAPWNKAMMCVGFDFHAYCRKRGIKQINCIGRGMVDVEDLVFIGTESIFKGKIGPEGTHETWEYYASVCKKYGYRPGFVLHAHKPHKTTLPSQQLQCLSGVSKETVKRLVDAAVEEIEKLRTGDGVGAITGNKRIAEILARVPQLAANESVMAKLQEGYENAYKTGMFGKLYNCSYGMFVLPDPIAMMSWAAYQDKAKIEKSIFAWHVVADVPEELAGKKAVMSRNPCTDLSGLCVVTVDTQFSSEYRKFFRGGVPVGCCFVSIDDTASTRLRMDFDGDHVNLCFVKAVVDAVIEASRIWYPELPMYPVIDWEAPPADKKVLTDEDDEVYYANLWHKSPLGHYMDLLTKVYSCIACGATAIDEDTKRAVAWLVYAVNVLVDAAKHGMGEIKEPEYVQKFAEVLLSKASGDGKKDDGKTVDEDAVASEYGDGILDTIAVLWIEKVKPVFSMKGCNYKEQFDARLLVSETRMPDIKGQTLANQCEIEHQDIGIFDLANKSIWRFYPFLRDANGDLTTDIPRAECYVQFAPGVHFADWGKARSAYENKNKFSAGDHIMVEVDDQTKVFVSSDETPNRDEAIKAIEAENKANGTNKQYKPLWSNLAWTEIPGKWLSHEAKMGYDKKTGKPRVTAVGSFFAILEGRRHEIENSYIDIEGDANDKKKAAADRAKLREYTSWSIKQSLRMYAALYGYTYTDAVDKLTCWLLRPRKVDSDGEVEKLPNKWLLDCFFDVCTGAILENIEKNADQLALYNVVMVKFDENAKNAQLYTYITEDLLNKGDMVVCPTPRGDKVCRVIASGSRMWKSLEAHAKKEGFTEYKVAVPYAG